ncbi:MAG: GatB/YqeY domain-containing protein [Oscillospiraceae bacterium]|nr:GatB/YqeY domain-containing protein [Oscillospiraceae bacterium]
MSLKETLNNDFKEAMKAKDKIRKDTINFVRAAIKQTEVDTREEVDDQGIAAILAKQVKMRKDALADFEAAGRQDMLDQYKAEIDVLMEYMPQQLTEEEMLNIVKQTAADLGIEEGSGRASMGKLMGPVMGKVKGLADGNDVKNIVLKFLG